MAHADVPAVQSCGNLMIPLNDAPGTAIPHDQPWAFFDETIFVHPHGWNGRRVIVHRISGNSCFDPKAPYARGSFRPGDYVLVDLTENRLSWPGPYLLNERGGLCVRWLQSIGRRDGKAFVHAHVRNPIYSPFECELSAIDIVGSIKGVFTGL